MKNNSTRHALITGAAGGIGRAICKALSGRGYRLSLVDVKSEELEKLASSLPDAIPITADLADLSLCRRAVDEALDKQGNLDVLVNVAAATSITPMTRVEPEEWERVLKVNLTAPAFLCRWAGQSMAENSGGVILNVGSIEADLPKGFVPAYAAAKGGLRSLTYDLANMWGWKNVRVVLLSPGAIDTPLNRQYESQDEGAELKSLGESMIPMRRWGRPEEIGGAVAWLASPEASYITGTEIVIDGGLSHSNLPHELRLRFTEQ